MSIFAPGTYGIISASSALQQVNVLTTIASNISATSGTLSASSAVAYNNLLLGAAQVLTTLVSQGQSGFQVSS